MFAGAALFMAATPALAQCLPSFFAAPANPATGDSPRSVAVGDFNGDERPDLAVSNLGGNTVSVLLGSLNGTFQPAVNYATGTLPHSVAVGDFNGDGRLDLAVANIGDNNVSILLGNANGTFQTADNYAAGAGPHCVAVGDFNADGRPDLAVANANSNNVSILLDNANGTFQAAVNYSAGVNPIFVAVGDFNADGRPDIAVANYLDGSISILLDNQDGTFQSAVNYAVGLQPIFIAVGDYNGDGRPDLAVANANSNNVSILLSRGNGAFQAAVNYATGSGPASIAVRDFNADGRLDLAVPNYNNGGDGGVSILRGNADGTFVMPITIAAGAGPVSLGVGDFNGDGRPDLAVANFSGNNISVLLNTTPYPVVSQQPASIASCPTGTATFSVFATGAAPFTYQWQIEDPSAAPPAFINLVDGPIVLGGGGGVLIGTSSGATTPDWQITLAASATRTNRVRCIVTNACGSVTSDEATLTICPADFNCDHVANSTDVSNFINAWFQDQIDGTLFTDWDLNGVVNSTDVSNFINSWFDDTAGPCGS